MAIPKLKKKDILDALKFIDANGVPEQNEHTKYVLVSADGKKVSAEVCCDRGCSFGKRHGYFNGGV